MGGVVPPVIKNLMLFEFEGRHKACPYIKNGGKKL